MLSTYDGGSVSKIQKEPGDASRDVWNAFRRVPIVGNLPLGN